MLRRLQGFLFGVLVASAMGGAAAGINYYTEETGKRLGPVLAATTCTSAVYTGWMMVGDVGSVTLDVTFVDANSSVTAVDMKCWTSDSSATANGSGYDVQALSVAAGVALSDDLRFCEPGSNTTCGGTDGSNPGSDSWSWTVSHPNAKLMNCGFSCSGTPAAADTLAVTARGVSP